MVLAWFGGKGGGEGRNEDVTNSDCLTFAGGWFRGCWAAVIGSQGAHNQVVGHESVSIAVKVVKTVKHIKVGDRVGVGA